MLGCYDDNNTVLLVNQDSNHPAVATVGMNRGFFASRGGSGGGVGGVGDEQEYKEGGEGGDEEARGAGRGQRVMEMMEVDPHTGRVVPARDDAPFLPGFQVNGFYDIL